MPPRLRSSKPGSRVKVIAPGTHQGDSVGRLHLLGTFSVGEDSSAEEGEECEGGEQSDVSTEEMPVVAGLGCPEIRPQSRRAEAGGELTHQTRSDYRLALTNRLSSLQRSHPPTATQALQGYYSLHVWPAPSQLDYWY